MLGWGTLLESICVFQCPYAPWCWFVYQHVTLKSPSFVGKYTIHGAFGVGKYIWKFPEMGVPMSTSKSSIFIGLAIISHPFWGFPIETPISVSATHEQTVQVRTKSFRHGFLRLWQVGLALGTVRSWDWDGATTYFLQKKHMSISLIVISYGVIVYIYIFR